MASSRLPIMIMSLLLAAGCTAPGAVPGDNPPAPQDRTAASRPTSAPPPEPAEADVRNDLESGKLSRRITARDVVLRVDYATSLPIEEWTASATKPFAVTASARLGGDGKQPKIYLSKLTISMDVRDQTGAVEPPSPLDDEAAIEPGFLISSPASYGQEFFVPPLTGGTRTVTLRLRYELLVESRTVEDSTTTKDYSRRTVTDIVVVPISGD